MAKTMNINGVAALVIAVALLGVSGMRILSLGNSTDPALKAAVRQALWVSLMGETGEKVARIRESGDYSEALGTVANAAPASIMILTLGASRPIFSWTSSERVVVHVKYRVQGSERIRERYLEYKHGLIGNSWSFQYDSTLVSYYLNLI